MQESDNHDNHVYDVFQLAGRCTDLLRLVVTVNGVDSPMDLNTGPAVSIVSHRTYCSTWPVLKRPTLRPSTARLRAYLGEILKVLGSIVVTASYHNQSKQLSLLVVPTDGKTLCG